MALIVDDFARGLDSGDLALVGAGLAGLAALAPSAQPVEDTEAGDKAQARPQRADVFAVKLAVDGRDGQQRHRVNHENRFAHEAQDEGRLERFHFGQFSGVHHGIQRQPHQGDEDEIFNRPQSLVHHLG